MNKNSNKKIKKRLKIKILPFVISIVIAIVIYSLYRVIINLPIKNIYIKGNNIYTDQEIIYNAKLEDYPSFFKTTNKKIINKLEKLAYINQVKIKRKIFNQIYIDVEEKKSLFINTNNLLVLSDGSELSNDRNIIVPMLINYVPDTKYKELIKKSNNIDSNIWNQVSEIKYEPTDQDKDRFGLYMNDGNLVYLTLTKFVKLNYYNEIINEFSCQKGILNLDSGNHFEIKENRCK